MNIMPPTLLLEKIANGAGNPRHQYVWLTKTNGVIEWFTTDSHIIATEPLVLADGESVYPDRLPIAIDPNTMKEARKAPPFYGGYWQLELLENYVQIKSLNTTYRAEYCTDERASSPPDYALMIDKMEQQLTKAATEGKERTVFSTKLGASVLSTILGIVPKRKKSKYDPDHVRFDFPVNSNGWTQGAIAVSFLGATEGTKAFLMPCIPENSPARLAWMEEEEELEEKETMDL